MYGVRCTTSLANDCGVLWIDYIVQRTSNVDIYYQYGTIKYRCYLYTKEKDMSSTVSLYPIIAALLASEEIIGPNLVWNPINGFQKELLNTYYTSAIRKEAHGIPEIVSKASYSVAEINEFLKEKGFDIQLTELEDPRSFAFASVLDLLVEWINEGIEGKIKVDGKTYPGVYIDDHRRGVSFYKAPLHEHVIACLQTKSNGRVFMTVAGDISRDMFLMMKEINTLSAMMSRIHDYKSVTFPMVQLNQNIDISKLAGMNTIAQNGVPVDIVQAVQQNKLRMNEIGARAESAVAMSGVYRSAVSHRLDLIIDQPFLVWFDRPGLSIPIFAGIITQEDWENPGSLT